MTATNEQITQSTNERDVLGTSSSHDDSPAQAHQASEPTAIHREPPIARESPEVISPAHNNAGDSPPAPELPPADPKVMTLLGMFPDFDVSLLQSVLQSVSGDQDRAIDALLGMSDPEYKPTARPDPTQTELDEEIARRIMLEETEQQQRSWQPHAAQQHVPYQQRSHTAPPQGHGQQRPAEGEGMAQFQEQLGKFAETGKKTFSSLFSKVKAKIQEFDSPSGQSQPSGSAPPHGGESWNTPAQSQSYYEPNPPPTVGGYNVAGTEPPHGGPMNPGGTEMAHPIGKSPPTTTLPTTAPAGNVDPSKIGLLPKHPVSLGSSPQPSRNLNDDEVEYVESPFEDSNRR